MIGRMGATTRFGSRRETAETRNYWCAPELDTEPEEHFNQARTRNESDRVKKLTERNLAVVAGYALCRRSDDAGLLCVRSGGYSCIPGPREWQSPAFAR